MHRTTRTSYRIGNRANGATKGRQRCNTEKNIAKTFSVHSNDASLLIQEQNKNKLNITKEITNNLKTVETQSILETCKSSIAIVYSYNQDLNTEVIKEKNQVVLFNNAQTISTCVQVKEEIIPYVEQFKTDETPVAVPIHMPSTPHRIKMPSEDLDEKATIITKEKQSVITLFSPLRIIKKPTLRGRKRVASNQSFSNRLSKPSSIETNHSITDYFPVRRSVRKSKKAVLEEKQRDLENKVLYQVEDGLEIRNFPGKGRGVITTREFAKGEFVVEYIGELISQGEAKEREEIYAQDQNTGCYMYYFQHRNQQYCVDATAETNKLGRLVNHSRTGNLIARIVEVSSIPHLVLTAKENIPIGVEITYDYGDRSRESIRHHPWLAL